MIKKFLEDNKKQIFDDLILSVEADSPTNNKELADNCAKVLCGIVENRLGVTPQVFKQENCGDHMLFKLNEGASKRVLFVGHYDTVWDKGSLEIKYDGNKLYGPGVYDMKSGLISAIWAAKALAEAGELSVELNLLFNSDEEVGSPTSKPIIADIAKGTHATLIGEPSEAVTGKLKTARKGSAFYTVNIIGKAAHAGNDHKGGINAIEEMARQVQYLHTLTDYEVGTTLSVGTCVGGTKTNVVPPDASFTVDVRYLKMSEATRINELIHAIKPSLSGASVTIDGSIGMPPLEATEQNKLLYTKAVEAGNAVGIKIDECIAGGASDGNAVSAMGIPTIDGLGAVGEGLHAHNEHIYTDMYIDRIALLAELVKRL